MRIANVEPARAAQLVGVAAQRLAHVQRGVAGALRVILVRDRRAEQRHDPVAGVLVHRALEAVHAVGEDLQEAVEDAVPLLRIDRLGELHRSLHVGEQDGDLLALALERRLRVQDLVGEVLRRVGARVTCRRRDRPRRESEGSRTHRRTGGRRVLEAAPRASPSGRKRACAAAAELEPGRILESAGGTGHALNVRLSRRQSSKRSRAPPVASAANCAAASAISAGERAPASTHVTAGCRVGNCSAAARSETPKRAQIRSSSRARGDPLGRRGGVVVGRARRAARRAGRS